MSLLAQIKAQSGNINAPKVKIDPLLDPKIIYIVRDKAQEIHGGLIDSDQVEAVIKALLWMKERLSK